MASWSWREAFARMGDANGLGAAPLGVPSSGAGTNPGTAGGQNAGQMEPNSRARNQEAGVPYQLVPAYPPFVRIANDPSIVYFPRFRTLIFGGNGAAGKSGARTARNDGNVDFLSGFDHSGDLFDVAGQYDDLRHDLKDRTILFVDNDIFRLDQHAALADDGAQSAPKKSERFIVRPAGIAHLCIMSGGSVATVLLGVLCSKDAAKGFPETG